MTPAASERPSSTTPARRSVTRRRTSAFTLVEVLIVITAMSILAGIVIPEVGQTLEDAKHHAMLYNLHELQAMIEHYRRDHRGTPPTKLIRMASSTNINGGVGTPGINFPFGPYVQALPPNSISGSDRVTVIAAYPPANPERYAGWIYDPINGRVWAGMNPDPAVVGTGTVESDAPSGSGS